MELRRKQRKSNALPRVCDLCGDVWCFRLLNKSTARDKMTWVKNSMPGFNKFGIDHEDCPDCISELEKVKLHEQDE